MRRSALLLPVLLLACGPGSQRPSVDFGVPPYAAIDLTGTPVEGPADAWVTIVEFVDYSCKHCADEVLPLEQVRAAHPADVRVAVKMFPFLSQMSLNAARAAWCAHQQGRFWPMHALLFANQPRFTDDDLAGYAAEITSMDVPSWKTCYAGAGAGQAVATDFSLGLALGVQATPTSFMNGKALVGEFPADQMDPLVQDAQAAAEASGVPRGEYYDKVILGH